MALSANHRSSRNAVATIARTWPKSTRAVAGHATSIAYGDGVIWVLDGPDRRIVGVIAATKEKLGAFAVLPDAQQMLFADGHLWLLHREQSCLARFDPTEGVR